MQQLESLPASQFSALIVYFPLGFTTVHVGEEPIYRVSQKSGKLDIRYFDIRKYSIILCSSDKTLSSEKNDTKII